MTNIRHKEALIASAEAARRVQQGLRQGVSPEFLTIDIRQTLIELDEVCRMSWKIFLSAIFSKFCIGK